MARSDHSTKQNRILLILFIISLCAVLLSSCGGEDSTDLHVKIFWNESEKVYLLPEEVVDAPSGEMRIEKNGVYLNRVEWQEKEILKSELERLKHHES